MYYGKEITEFFKRHNLYNEEMFEYLKEHTDWIDYRDEDERWHIGHGIYVHPKTRKIIRFRICIPEIRDDMTLITALHEIAHGIWSYIYMVNGIKYSEDESELFPFLVERAFLEEHKSQKLSDLINKLDSLVDDKDDIRYRYAKDVRDRFKDIDIGNVDRIQKVSRRALRIWKKNNR